MEEKTMRRLEVSEDVLEHLKALREALKDVVLDEEFLEKKRAESAEEFTGCGKYRYNCWC